MADFDLNTSFSDINTGLFGTDIDVSSSGTTDVDETVTEKLELDKEGILALIDDVLGGTQGLASIFSEENVAGLYNSSVAKEASGDLISQIAGEIAKLTGTKTSTRKGTTTKVGSQSSSSPGLLENIPVIGGLF